MGRQKSVCRERNLDHETCHKFAGNSASTSESIESRTSRALRPPSNTNARPPSSEASRSAIWLRKSRDSRSALCPAKYCTQIHLRPNLASGQKSLLKYI